MFDIGWTEIAVIAVVAIIVIGPRDLPRALRTMGQWIGKARRMAREFQRSIDDMINEADLADVRKDVESLGKTDFKKSIEDTIDPTGDLKHAFEVNPDQPSPTEVFEPKDASDAIAAPKKADAKSDDKASAKAAEEKGSGQ